MRGSAFQLNEKYSSLASEAQANDDKVLAESYLQFSDHYYRLNKEIEVAVEARINDNPNLNKDNDMSNLHCQVIKITFDPNSCTT